MEAAYVGLEGEDEQKICGEETCQMRCRVSTEGGFTEKVSMSGLCAEWRMLYRLSMPMILTNGATWWLSNFITLAAAGRLGVRELAAVALGRWGLGLLILI